MRLRNGGDGGAHGAYVETLAELSQLHAAIDLTHCAPLLAGPVLMMIDKASQLQYG